MQLKLVFVQPDKKPMFSTYSQLIPELPRRWSLQADSCDTDQNWDKRVKFKAERKKRELPGTTLRLV